MPPCDDAPMDWRIGEFTLYSVLSEAMARDLVHGTYTPCPELAGVVGLLRHTGLASKNHLLSESTPQTLPAVYLGPQLLHCAHRNAVSSAYKYGQHNGGVVTRLTLRPHREQQPGEQEHEPPVPRASQNDYDSWEQAAPEASRESRGASQPPHVASAADCGAFLPVRRSFCEYELALEVVNASGPQHAKFLQVAKQSANGFFAQDQVFTQGSRLHPELVGHAHQWQSLQRLLG